MSSHGNLCLTDFRHVACLSKGFDTNRNGKENAPAGQREHLGTAPPGGPMISVVFDRTACRQSGNSAGTTDLGIARKTEVPAASVSAPSVEAGEPKTKGGAGEHSALGTGSLPQHAGLSRAGDADGRAKVQICGSEPPPDPSHLRRSSLKVLQVVRLQCGPSQCISTSTHAVLWLMGNNIAVCAHFAAHSLWQDSLSTSSRRIRKVAPEEISVM